MPKYNDFNLDIQVSNIDEEELKLAAGCQSVRSSCHTNYTGRNCGVAECCY